MPEPHAAPDAVGASDDLAERGRALVFDVTLHGQPARGFVLRVDGRVRGFVNRCAHVPSELDWVEGEFLDRDGREIVCAVHGAAYDPEDGRCLGGPCDGRGLAPIAVDEAGGRVRWYPSRDLRAPRPAPGPAGGDEPTEPNR